MRKTKIICTYGPAIHSLDKIKEIIQAGANIIRFNFSHGDYEYHKTGMDYVKQVREELDLPVGILLDTKGPEIRTGLQDDEFITLVTGKTIEISGENGKNTNKCIYVDYPNLVNAIQEGSKILIDDGNFSLVVKKKKGTNLVCEVLSGGKLKQRKSMNIPNVDLGLDFLSEQDKEDLSFGVSQNIDIIAASFTRTAEDIKTMRSFLYQHDHFTCDIVAKIENHDGVENIEEICFVADGIMIARGDLGVELPVENVPHIQKEIIKMCRKIGKPVITATQMLESMIDSPRPTRAEVSDVANAIYDATSAIMLSGETASGKFPLECVKLMNTVALKTESDINYQEQFNEYFGTSVAATKALANAALTTAYSLDISAIVAITTSGYAARLISRLRPSMDIIAPTHNRRTYYRMALYWGVRPLLVHEKPKILGELFSHITEKIEEEELLPKGSMIILMGGSPVGVSGSTNVLRVGSVGNVASRGRSLVKGRIEGIIHRYKSKKTTPEDCILVMRYLLESDLSVLRKAKGLILQGEKGEEMARVAGETLNIPVISRCESAYQILHENERVTVDGDEGIVYRIK